MKLIFGFSVIASLIGCTDTLKANFEAIGRPGHITCFSGGQKFYEGDSTGIIQTVEQSDGWEFKDAKTGKFIRVSGACLIQN
jgi:hypothetical protein